MKRSAVIAIIAAFLLSVTLAYQFGKAASHYDAETIRQSKEPPDPRKVLETDLQLAKSVLTMKGYELEQAQRAVAELEEKRRALK